MPNLLHTFLLDGFDQATDFLGEEFTLGSVTTTGFFSQADEQTSIELTGVLDEVQLLCVCKTTAFVSKPTINRNFTYQGSTYRLRAIKSDQSAYVLGFKKIST